MKFRLTRVIGAVAIALVLGGCGSLNTAGTGRPPSALSAAQLTRMSAGERLRLTRPALRSGTRIYREHMALIESPGTTTVVPRGDVLAISGGTITYRLGGEIHHIDNATVSSRDDISETYVPPGIAVPLRQRGETPAETVR
jgi:hypothetical protein